MFIRFAIVVSTLLAFSTSFVLETSTRNVGRTILSRHFSSNVPEVQVVNSMPEALSGEGIKNHYYLLRHGLSTANVAEVISSARSLAYSDKHGLTPTGYEQGKQSATQLLDVLSTKAKPGEKLVFISSPFARARQTAQACLDGLDEIQERIDAIGLEVDHDIVMEDNLMERYFGRLDNEAIYTYAYVWPLDKFNVTHTAFDVESVAAVCHRLSKVVKDLEKRYVDTHLVWVSHADVLQIAQLYAANVDNVGAFSSYRFKNGEVRPMLFGSTEYLPDPAPLQAPERTTRTG